MVDFEKDVLGRVYESGPKEKQEERGPGEDYLKAVTEGIRAAIQSTRVNKKESRGTIAIYKYSGNGRLSLQESVVIGNITKFVTLPSDYSIDDGNGNSKPTFVKNYVSETATFVPNGNVDTITPMSYVFASEVEFTNYLVRACAESYDSLYLKVETVIRKYVNVEEYYYPVLTGDIVWTYFQDRFPYNHYLIFTGDNGSGKNSTLLVFRYLGYRVFYILSANAADYYTVMGSHEEGQVTIAEDEVDDLGLDKKKRDILKAGYASGASVPRIDLEGGRKMDNWLVYCHKWLATEEWKEDKNTKGILHRSLKLKFLAGDVPYNIKDVVRFADDPEYKPLHDELIELRKLLFCFRLLHYKDPILNVKLNVKGRTAELVSPLIRLFQNSPIARARLLDSLTKFIKERNESMLDSFEAKLRKSIQYLIDARLARSGQPTDEDRELGPFTLTNESIKDKFVSDTEAREDPEKKGMYYSPEVGVFSQAKITSILKSKFKARVGIVKRIGEKTHRCAEFNQDYLNRMKASYEVPEKIEVVTPVTPVTPFGSIGNSAKGPAMGEEFQKDTEITNNKS
jgi:hypothetical protein